jgi:hypothetical protein
MSFKLLVYLEEVVLLLLVISLFIIHDVVQITVPVCYISEGDTRETVESCLSYLREVSEEAYRRRVPAESGKTRPPRCSTLELYTQECWNTQTR